MPGSDLGIVVIGAGSIGARHARNLVAANAAVDIVDPDAGRAAALGPDIRAVADDKAWLGRYNGVVVASPTFLHRDHVMRALDTGAHVLVEKPLAHNSTELEEMLSAADGRLMVGYNLRFHEPVQQFMAMAHNGRVGRLLAARAWFGSWLPAWRPGVDYRATYSARSELGGGVLLDASHELDLLLWLIPGDLHVVGAIVARLGDLDIDVEDTVRAVLRGEHGVAVELSLDYLSRRYHRGIEVTGTEGNLRLDWARRAIEIESADDTITIPIAASTDSSYKSEIEYFLNWIRGGPPPPVGAQEGAASVLLAEAICGAAR